MTTLALALDHGAQRTAEYQQGQRAMGVASLYPEPQHGAATCGSVPKTIHGGFDRSARLEEPWTLWVLHENGGSLLCGRLTSPLWHLSLVLQA